jgi:hypothetical protein
MGPGEARAHSVWNYLFPFTLTAAAPESSRSWPASPAPAAPAGRRAASGGCGRCGGRRSSRIVVGKRSVPGPVDPAHPGTALNPLSRSITMTTLLIAGLATGLIWAPVAFNHSAAPDTVPPGSLVPKLRIGSVDGVHDAFVAIEDLEVGRDGEIFVVDPRGDGIPVFSAAGEHLRTIGRSGAGPGEFRLPFRIGTRNDTVWVHDLGLRRLNLFDSAGAHLESLGAVDSSGSDSRLPPQAPLAVLSDASCLVHHTVSDRLLADQDDLTTPVVRTDCGGATLGTIARLSRTNEILAIRHPERPQGGIFTRQPLADQPLWSVAPDGSGIWIVHRRAAERSGRASFRVIGLAPAGDTIANWTVSYRPIAVTASDRYRLVTEWIERALAVPGGLPKPAHRGAPGGGRALPARVPSPSDGARGRARRGHLAS